MIHTQSISTEATGGLTGKGKKSHGKQSLFSKLLATLGQGTEKKATKHQATKQITSSSEATKNQAVKLSLNPELQQNKKKTTLTTSLKKEANSNKDITSENSLDQGIQVVASLQPPLDMQNLSKAKNKGQLHLLSNKIQARLNTASQSIAKDIQQLSVSSNEVSIEQQGGIQPIPKGIHQLSTSTNEASVKQKYTPNIIPNTEQKVSEKQQALFTTSKQTSTNLMTSFNQVTPNIQTTSKETSNELSNNNIATDNKVITEKTISHINSSQVSSTTQPSNVAQSEPTAKERNSAKINITEPKVEKPQDHPVIDAQLATSIKAPHPKVQPNQGVDQVGVASVSSTSSIKTTEAGSNTSQQDFTSEQQDLNGFNMDTSKQDTKLKGADFQAQLAYKSQRTFTPADAMLEIVKSAKDGSTTLELQLEPAHLGKVQVQIQMDTAKNIQVAFTVDQQTSRQALEQHMPQLRLALSQQGLDLGSFSMQMNQQQHQEHQSSHSVTNTSTWTNQTIEDQADDNKIGINIATDGRLSILA